MTRSRSQLPALLALAIAVAACGGGGAVRSRRPPVSPGPAQYVDVFVPEPARGELGLSGAALDGAELVDPAEAPGLVPRVAALARPARECLSPPAAAWVTFRIWRDGHASVEHVATLAAPPAVRRCLDAAVSSWTFPELAAPRGAVLVQIFPLAPPPSHAVLPLDPEDEGAAPSDPVPVEPGCVAAGMRRAPGAAELARAGARTVAMFAVDRSGIASRFHVLEPTALPVAATVRGAVDGCRWRPAIADGRPLPVWVVQEFRFEPAAE